ncbi:iron-sulfur cluster assembly scaffold protein [Paracoccus sp. p3-h83]|uniref:iron-sulfur cluster assembly scaffold protein n=1 Tax=Paracoccus sp. p3-h83 TaxID=3342805 RepID=UPI0035BACFCE
MSESELIQLYSKRILALAAAIPHLGRLPAPMGSASRRAPLCGSTITVDVTLAEGRVSDFAQDVKACALGQASAAILGGVVIGLSRDQIAEGRAALAALLAGQAPALPAPFDGLAVLAAARDYPNRHASILLAYDATLDAIDAAQSQ